MGVPISVRLDDDVRRELEERAHSQGIGLATLLRDLATQAAREARRARIHEASKAVADRMRASPDGQAFYDAWGTPNSDA